MTRYRLIASALALAVGFTATMAMVGTATAQIRSAPNCADRDTITRSLESRFGEQRTAVALDAGGRLVEVYTSAKTGTWTITLSTTSGVTCIASSGEAWQPMQPVSNDPAS